MPMSNKGKPNNHVLVLNSNTWIYFGCVQKKVSFGLFKNVKLQNNHL